ncbi:MAG: acyltransferase [Verrucomicrobiales bacterium]
MFLNQKELEAIGFKKLGSNVRVSKFASIYSPHLIEIGDSSRIDDFVVLSPSGGLKIGKHVHIACFCSVIGKGPVTLGHYSGLSGRVSIYSSTDDYSGKHMTNPTVPDSYTEVRSGPVDVGEHVIIGAGSIVLPNVKMGLGAAVFAQSLVIRNCKPFTIYGGSPAKKIRERNNDILKHAENFESEVDK